VAQSVISLDKPQDQQTRTELTLGQIGQEWKYQPRGQAFTSALVDFLRAIRSRNTLRSYSFSILQFFEWYRKEKGRIVTPDQVRRADAVEFARWLREHDDPLTEERLRADPSRRDDLIIFEVVKDNPGINLEGLRTKTFMTRSYDWYVKRLGCLVRAKTLVRTPTVEEYRRANGGAVIRPPEDVFRYYVPKVQAPSGAERASMMVTRLSALSSLWKYFITSSTENVPGREEPLLRFNIWTPPLKQVLSEAPSFRQQARKAKQTPLTFFLRLLATTFTRTHGGGALAAAEAAFWGRPVPPPIRGREPTFKDVRDRALLIFMAQTGARSVEVHRLKRRDYDRPMVTLLGKRNKKRKVIVPPAAQRALVEMDVRIQKMAEHQLRYQGKSRAASLLSRDDAPLIPAVAYWGANAGTGEAGLTRPGIAMMLRRRAEKAGIEPGSPDFQRAHPHGLRGLFARIAIEGGTPMNRVQKMLGHTSVATTGLYIEEFDEEKMIAEPFRLRPQPEAPSGARVAPRATVPGRSFRELPPEPEVPTISSEDIEPMGVPEAPRPRLRPARPQAEERRPARPQTREVEPVEAVEFEDLGSAPGPSSEEAFIQNIEKRRGKRLTSGEDTKIQTCLSLDAESIRRLCIIYRVHWGEKGNRQQLIKSGGRKKQSLVSKMEFIPNQSEFDEDFDEDEDDEDLSFEDFGKLVGRFDEPDDEPIVLDPKIEEARQRQRARADDGRLYGPAGLDLANWVFSGKESGLNWWLGTDGKLSPAMPVMSPGQVGDCGPDDGVCRGLSELWMEWASDAGKFTRVLALEKWIEESLKVTAQVQDVLSGREGRFVAPEAPWPETKLRGSFRAPEPREVFREHLPEEIIAWFRVRGGQYRTTPGTPEGWEKKQQTPQPMSDLAPAWYADSDPVYDLPFDEREEMLDWLAAATNQPVRSMKRQFDRFSRVDVAKFIDALCSIDGSLDQLQEEKARSRGQVNTRSFEAAAQRVSDELEVFVSRVANQPGYDAMALIKKRKKGELQTVGAGGKRQRFYLNEVRKLFGKEAAEDRALRLVALCDKAPLSAFRELFNIESQTIVHTMAFKEDFALRHQAHSECVARRIARRLWEIIQGRQKGKQYIQRPEFTSLLVEIMKSYKVPCAPAQEDELRRMLRRQGMSLERPEGIIRAYESIRERSTVVEPTFAESMFDDFNEEFASARQQEFVGDIFRENYRRNGNAFDLPTPVHLWGAIL